MANSLCVNLLVLVLCVFGLAHGKSRESDSAADKGSCRELGRCCQGKDNSCRVKLLPDNYDDDWNSVESDDGEKKEVNATSAACFCDSACLKIGDCCGDYQDHCKAVDCIVADQWDEWSECDSRCGSGVKQRTRKVLQVPMNGGQPCPSLLEKIPCEGINCKIARAPEGYEQQRETAKIIPASFGSWRESKLYHPFKDIRKNLFDHYETKNKVGRPSYCTVFEITEVQSACKPSSGTWSSGLIRGTEVCVECQELAMKKKLGGRCKGEGARLKETRWNAVMSAGCHGKWRMISRQENCTCNADSESKSFILL